ncbi:35692_t:CDS:2 [Gigaspora margarita]|uniref:35692_t:CDS:1 n=1 Tax=Gigaspora margarita TaxID=4874 RepID=A0ABN7VCM3_GIGMA|nr:35692_t:CDS:2 [Gigaspora margarita]
MGRVRKDSVHDSSFANNKTAKLSAKKLTTNNLCTKCKKEESVDGRWIQCDRCLKWYHTACVRIQLDDNGEFSEDYYCIQCRELDILEHSSSEKEYTPSRKLSISSASSSRSSGSTSHKKLKSNNGTSHIPSPEPYILENGTNSTTEAEHDNNNHSPHVIQVERQETVSITTSTVSVSETTIFHPYNFPNPISYNRALLRVAQIREFILTHCPAATKMENADGAENGGNRPVSLQLAEELWKKMEKLEKTHDRRKYNNH